MCWLAMSLLALLGGAVLLPIFDFNSMLAGLNALNAQLAQHPILLMLALAILPGIGLPISPLLIVFGTSLTPQHGLITTCLLGIAMQSFCTTWSYLIAAGPLKKLPHTMAASALYAAIAPVQGRHNRHPVDTTRTWIPLCTTKHNFRADRCSTENVPTHLHADHGDDKQYFYLFGSRPY